VGFAFAFVECKEWSIYGDGIFFFFWSILFYFIVFLLKAKAVLKYLFVDI
jgi:hypothetical protein